MIVEQITITDKPTSIWENKVFNFVFWMVVIIPVIIYFILMFIYYEFSDFITKKILGRPDQPIEFKEKILYQNPNYKLVEEDIFLGFDSNKLAADFIWSIMDHDAEECVLKVLADKETIELNNCFLTNFKFETENEIFLQRIAEKDNKPSSELISLIKTTGETNKIMDIGLYLLYKYEEEANEIIGGNKTNLIKIKVSDIKPVTNSNLPKVGGNWFKNLISNKKTLS